MMQRESIFGLPLHTRRQRRLVVYLYYALVLVLALVPSLRDQRHPALFMLIPQTVVLGSLLGGLTYGRPVKPYGDGGIAMPRDPDAAEIIQLRLDAAIKPWRGNERLDEREMGERDHAHFLAYRVLLVLIGVAAVLAWLGVGLVPVWLATNYGALLWLAAVVVISLPQSVILWIEPNPLPEATMHLVERAS